MPIPSPFYEQTSALCRSHEWRDWAGYLAAVTYDVSHEHEYFAVRNAAALFDITPLFKYDITGPDAARLINRAITRDIDKCATAQVLYTVWCDDHGKIIDDGTVQRFAENHFRVTAAEPNFLWFSDCGYGLDVHIEDVTDSIAALSVQGPLARRVLTALLPGSGIDKLGFFRIAQTEWSGTPLTITRTGYTGDLGYELWCVAEAAGRLWEGLMQAGKPFGLLPAGLAALDIARIEAGLLLAGVDYISSLKALTESQKSSPFEAGLGWTVHLHKENFVGKPALMAEKARGSDWQLVGLEIDWPSLEKVFYAADLPPQVTGRASRSATPIYKNGRQIGQATSTTFSPILKKYIALASVRHGSSAIGETVDLEVTVEYERTLARATVVPLPFYNPPHKRA